MILSLECVLSELLNAHSDELRLKVGGKPLGAEFPADPTQLAAAKWSLQFGCAVHIEPHHAEFEQGAVGAILSSNLLLTGIGSLVATGIGSRFGRLQPIVASLLLMACCMAGLGLHPNLLSFALSICGLGLAMGLVMPFQLAAIAAGDRNGRLVSLIAAVQGGGTALAPPLAGWALETYGPGSIALIGLVSVFGGLGCSIASRAVSADDMPAEQ